MIDEFTGRVAQDRRWPAESTRHSRLRKDLRFNHRDEFSIPSPSSTSLHFTGPSQGTSGTAQEATRELWELERFESCGDPAEPSMCTPQSFGSRVHDQTRELGALVEEIASEHRRGRPILVGTASITESENLAEMLRHNEIACRVLNAANDDQEAEIIAEAELSVQ